MSRRMIRRSEPSELQKLYGSDLPPSLRWGAIRDQSEPQPQAAPRRPRNVGSPVFKEQPHRSHGRKWETDDPIYERERRPYASERAPVPTHHPQLQLRDRPEHADYPGSRSQWKDHRDAKSQPAHPREGNARRVARDWYERSAVGERRRYQPSVEDVKESEREHEQGQDSTREREREREQERATGESTDPPARSSVAHRPPRSHDGAGQAEQTESAGFVNERNDVEDQNFLAAFETEFRRRLTTWGYSDETIHRYVKGDDGLQWTYPTLPTENADNKSFQARFQDEMRRRLEILGYAKGDIDWLVDEDAMNRYASGGGERRRRDALVEAKLQEEFRLRLRKLGYTGETLDVMVDREKAQKFVDEVKESRGREEAHQPKAPVFPKIHRDYLDIETLTYYDLPWEHDPRDPDYLIILRELDQKDTDVLFAHTARLRENAKMQQATGNGLERSRYGEFSADFILLPHRGRSGDRERWDIGRCSPFVEKWSKSERSRRESRWFEKRIVDPLDHPSHRDDRKSGQSTSGPRPVIDDDDDDDDRAQSVASSTSQIIKPPSQDRPATPRSGLKRVIYATYGGIVNHEPDAEPSMAGFVAVPTGHRPRTDKLYHLLHVKQDVLDFEDFKAKVVSLWPRHDVRHVVADHLDQVQKLHEKDLRTGHTNRYMETCLESKERDGIDVLFACVPFPHLVEHSHPIDARRDVRNAIRDLFRRTGRDRSRKSHVTSSGSAHPTRTLFQSLNPRLHSRRDLKQVICHTLDRRDRRYMSVSQLWCLIINEELIITCSVLSEKDLYGDLLKTPGAFYEQPPMQRTGFLSVKTPDQRTWLLRHSDCLTYFDFASHFSDITMQFVVEYSVHVNGKEVSPHEWSERVVHAMGTPLHVDLKDRSLTTQDSAFNHVMTPEASSLFKMMAFKLFPRKEQVTLFRHPRRVRMGLQDRTGEYETGESGHDNGRAEDHLGRGHDDKRGSIPREPDLGKHNESDRYDGREDAKLRLPKWIVTRDMLRRQGIEFTEDDGDGGSFTLPYSRQTEGLIAAAIALEPKDLCAITFETLSAAPQHVDEIDTSRSAGVKMTRAQDLGGERGPSLDETELYDGCGSLTISAYQKELQAWYRTSSMQKEDPPPIPLAIRDVEEFCLALGYHYIAPASDGDFAILFDGYHFANIQDGLRDLLRIFSSSVADDELQAEQDKLRAAILGLVVVIHRALQPSTMKFGIFVLRMISMSFNMIFKVTQEMELYLASLPLMLDTGGISPDEVRTTIRRITLAMLIAIRSISELEYDLPRVEEEILKQGKALIEMQQSQKGPYSKKDPFGYQTAREFGKYMFDAMEDDSEQPKPQHEALQRTFTEGLRRLRASGWDRTFARAILRNEFRWNCVLGHTQAASVSLRHAFTSTLSRRIPKKLPLKAAALPTDLLLLLLPSLLWRPLSPPSLGDLDALDMYNQYITSLEAAILTGDSSREPLERIRHLRYELKAFALLQSDHLDLLSRLSALLASREPSHRVRAAAAAAAADDDDDPHPRLPLLSALTRGTALQSANLRLLDSALDDLQSEARAHLLGAQDWRDNAGVVFAVVAVVFLPLSLVAAIFGMNTNDVRNMDVDQWAFWTAGLAFTLVVVGITLWVVDVPPLWRWVDGRRKEDEGEGGEGGGGARVGLRGRSGKRERFLVELARREVEIWEEGEKEGDGEWGDEEEGEEV